MGPEVYITPAKRLRGIMVKKGPTVLLILDGWGYRHQNTYNAIANAKTPQWDHWWATRPHRLLDASGLAVGLPEGQMGNSEVGHMHIGAGRQILQDLTYINQDIKQGRFAENPVFINAIQKIKQNNRAIHVMGLLSDGGVHSHEAHLHAFIALCQSLDCPHVYLHLFMDGRDTPPQSASIYLERLQPYLNTSTKISTLTGRYYAMDRDKRWTRTEQAYRAIIEGNAQHHYETTTAAIQDYYQQGITDEFFPPTQLGEANPIEAGDSVFFFNFRADRARQLTEAIISTENNTAVEFARKPPELTQFISMTDYGAHLITDIAFSPRLLHNTLGEVLAKQGLKQLRIAETEKYAHVTFFFNGGTETCFSQEDRCLIPSPKIATYDLQPEMSADSLTEKLVAAIEEADYDVIICNYANADMVGHSGNFDATIKAIESLDKAMQRIGQAIEKTQGALLITADHGNAECMFDEATQQPHTAHTCEPVPLLYIGSAEKQFKPGPASLADVAPTLLALLNMTKPNDMTGQNLWA